MSLKLDEKDVRDIASRRYWTKLTRKVMVYFSLLFALTIGLVVVLDQPWTTFAMVPLLVGIGWFVKLVMEERKAKTELVKKWKEEESDTNS